MRTENQKLKEVINQIHAFLKDGVEFKVAPKKPSLLGGVMAIKKGEARYAISEAGELVGLNLTETGLDDSKWKKVVKLLNDNEIRLQALNLSDNGLEQLILPEGGEKLERFEVDDNPLTVPPPEIVQQGSQSILSWFASFKKEDGKEKQYLKEIKILLVGEGSAGKTSLLKQMKGLPFDKNENQTHGVNVEKMEVKTLDLFEQHEHLKDVIIRVWDFGGQEIMHASHQFFLTHRSIYVFVLDSRTDNKKDYWLRHIDKFGGDSPAIVVINKIDENKNYSLEESTLNKKYPFVENRFIKLSCKTGVGKDQFASTLAELIPNTEYFTTPISESWYNIKEQLETETTTQQYINRERFLEICALHGEEDETAHQTILNYLNSLGVVLHFPGLQYQDFYVLDPHWVTIGVYKIINSPSITDGILEEQTLNYILNKEEQKKGEYDPNKEKKIKYKTNEQSYLIGIMKEFELLYEFKKAHYLVPDLLPKELTKTVPFDQSDAVSFIMEYDFLPPNVMSRFIIHMKNDIRDLSQLWRNGAYFYNAKSACFAEVKADMDRQRISIRVNGPERRKREYFAVVLHGLYTINEKFSDLKVTEKMPVPEHPEIEYDFQELLGLERMGEDRLVIGRLGKVLSVSCDFLDRITTRESRQQRKGQEGNENALLEQILEVKRIAKDAESNTLAILDNQQVLQKYLDTILVDVNENRAKVESLFSTIELIAEGQTAEVDRINEIIEQVFDRYRSQLPAGSEKAKSLADLKEKQVHIPDAKWKMKLKIPFIFAEFEKELSWDVKNGLKMIKKELNAYRKGEKTLKELFIEDDED